jgi:RNA polymerase sigma-70 factor (ECF subfamily)
VREPSDEEDLAKVREFLGGDSHAFEFLFEKYRDRVYRIAYRFVRNKDDALDVAQDVFLRVYTGIKGFKTDSKFFTWLYRISTNRAIDFTRQKRSRAALGVETPLLEAEGRPLPGRSSVRDPADLAEEKELDEKLARAVDGLSEKHRAVFTLHATENLSYREIAEVLGCSIGTVMSRLFYARKKIQETLRRAGLERPGRGAAPGRSPEVSHE